MRVRNISYILTYKDMYEGVSTSVSRCGKDTRFSDTIELTNDQLQTLIFLV